MAKKFNFKLEPILKLRNYKTNTAKESLSQALTARYAKETEINQVMNQKNNWLDKPTKSAKVWEMQAKQNHLNLLDIQNAKLEKEKQQIVEIENVRRAVLANAMKDEKIIEKLKEKQKERHWQETEMEERNFLDEISIRRYIATEKEISLD